ncbi:MAG: VOC family protein [Patescibacteria group bacterium]
MDKLQAIVGDYAVFLGIMLEKVAAAGFDLDDFVQMDHMCYRVSSLQDYAQKKQELQSVATLLHETRVNGRPIASFRLHEPVKVKGWRVDTIELPAPKDGSAFAEGLEHIEFVIYDDIPAFLRKYSDKTFDMQSADRGINPEIGYKLDNGCGVKFHLLSLPAVVYLEKKLGITEVSSKA